MGKHFVAETMRLMEKQERRQYREDDDQREEFDEWRDKPYEREIQQMRGDW
jgi:hypothetical protein